MSEKAIHCRTAVEEKEGAMEDIKAPLVKTNPEIGSAVATAAMNQGLTPYTPLQLLSLTRLKELLEKQKNATRAELWVSKALSKAVYSVFLDCVGLGVEKEARDLLDEPATPTKV